MPVRLFVSPCGIIFAIKSAIVLDIRGLLVDPSSKKVIYLKLKSLLLKLYTLKLLKSNC